MKENHTYGKGFIDKPGWHKETKTEVDWWTPPEVFEKLKLEFVVNMVVILNQFISVMKLD